MTPNLRERRHVQARRRSASLSGGPSLPPFALSIFLFLLSFCPSISNHINNRLHSRLTKTVSSSSSSSSVYFGWQHTNTLGDGQTKDQWREGWKERREEKRRGEERRGEERRGEEDLQFFVTRPAAHFQPLPLQKGLCVCVCVCVCARTHTRVCLQTLCLLRQCVSRWPCANEQPSKHNLNASYWSELFMYVFVCVEEFVCVFYVMCAPGGVGSWTEQCLQERTERRTSVCVHVCVHVCVCVADINTKCLPHLIPPSLSKSSPIPPQGPTAPKRSLKAWFILILCTNELLSVWFAGFSRILMINNWALFYDDFIFLFCRLH